MGRGSRRKVISSDRCMPLARPTQTVPDARRSIVSLSLRCCRLVASCAGEMVIKVVSQSSSFVLGDERTARPSSIVRDIFTNVMATRGEVVIFAWSFVREEETKIECWA